MSLQEQITADMKAAMKAKDSATLSTLRMLRSAIKNKQIDAPEELTDADVQAIIKSSVKQLKDSAASFQEAGRDEMAADSLAEIEILKKYLPEELSDEALEQIVIDTIAQTGATSKADMGKVMGAAMAAAKGAADGNRVKNFVMKHLPVLALAFLLPSSTQAAIPMAHEVGFDGAMMEMGLRLFRVMVLWFGVMALVIMLQGAFEYMTASMRDQIHEEAGAKISKGFLVSIVVLFTFAISTVMLQQL